MKDREVWHPAVHGVTKGWTRLSNRTTTHTFLPLWKPLGVSALMMRQNDKNTGIDPDSAMRSQSITSGTQRVLHSTNLSGGAMMVIKTMRMAMITTVTGKARRDPAQTRSQRALLGGRDISVKQRGRKDLTFRCMQTTAALAWLPAEITKDIIPTL